MKRIQSVSSLKTEFIQLAYDLCKWLYFSLTRDLSVLDTSELLTILIIATPITTWLLLGAVLQPLVT